jgi:1,4-dihydroxy-2-naphthoate octaprenyltransferase
MSKHEGVSLPMAAATLSTRIRPWILAARPKTLPASLSGVVVGTALAAAADSFQLLAALAAAVCALLLQIGSNYANDYFDYVKGTDTAERAGPTRVTASGLVELRTMRVAILTVFGAAALVGLYLIAIGGWPLLLAGAAALVAAVSYTGGPFPFGYYGAGDLAVFLFFGLVAVCGTYYVQVLALDWTVVAAALPVGALTTCILVVNNLRDIETDRRAGKRTLAVMLGRRVTRIEYIALLVVAYLTPAGLTLARVVEPWVLLPLATIPLALRLVKELRAPETTQALNHTLAGTARLSLVFSLLFAIGLLL